MHSFWGNNVKKCQIRLIIFKHLVQVFLVFFFFSRQNGLYKKTLNKRKETLYSQGQGQKTSGECRRGQSERCGFIHSQAAWYSPADSLQTIPLPVDMHLWPGPWTRLLGMHRVTDSTNSEAATFSI